MVDAASLDPAQGRASRGQGQSHCHVAALSCSIYRSAFGCYLRVVCMVKSRSFTRLPSPFNNVVSSRPAMKAYRLRLGLVSMRTSRVREVWVVLLYPRSNAKDGAGGVNAQTVDNRRRFKGVVGLLYPPMGRARQGFYRARRSGVARGEAGLRVVTPGRFGVATYTGPICWVVPGTFSKPFI